jgi:hypothetical protein
VDGLFDLVDDTHLVLFCVCCEVVEGEKRKRETRHDQPTPRLAQNGLAGAAVGKHASPLHSVPYGRADAGEVEAGEAANGWRWSSRRRQPQTRSKPTA